MSEPNDPFFPRRVDEFIEEVTLTHLDMSPSRDREKKVLHDLQALYITDRHRFRRALQRVEDRLVAQRLTHHEDHPMALFSRFSSPENPQIQAICMRRGIFTTLMKPLLPGSSRFLRDCKTTRRVRRSGGLCACFFLSRRETQ